MNDRGVTAFVLRYRVGLESREASMKAAIEDGLLAVKTVRQRAGEWKLNPKRIGRSEEHTSELQSQSNLVCRLLLEKKKGISVDFSFLQDRLALPLSIFIIVILILPFFYNLQLSSIYDYFEKRFSTSVCLIGSVI